MAQYDLIIRGGTIVDGTGAAAFTGDVAITGGLIAAVGRITGSAAEEIDASGKVVAPGFVDIHTHLDKGHIWPRRANPDGTWLSALLAVGADREAHWAASDVERRMTGWLAQWPWPERLPQRVRIQGDAEGPVVWPLMSVVIRTGQQVGALAR